MCAIMRHLLEDPATLQAAMEAEIRSTLAPHTREAGTSLVAALRSRNTELKAQIINSIPSLEAKHSF